VASRRWIEIVVDVIIEIVSVFSAKARIILLNDDWQHCRNDIIKECRREHLEAKRRRARLVSSIQSYPHLSSTIHQQTKSQAHKCSGLFVQHFRHVSDRRQKAINAL
jgi:hypothetical protein